MTVPPDLEAQILRYHHVEKWRAGTIARQLSVHYDTVMRVLLRAGLSRNGAPLRGSQIEPYLQFIGATLEKFPELTASRLFVMVRERGYRGGPDYFRHLVARHRPRRPAEAYLRLRSLPGEQAQVDWGHFGHLTIGRARRPLLAFVMVLSWSRRIFLRFFLVRAWRTSYVAMSRHSRPSMAVHVSCCTTISKAPCWNVSATPSGSTRRCLHSQLTIATSRGQWRWRAATRKAGSSAPSAMCAPASSPLVRSPISTISTPRPQPGATAWQPTGHAPSNTR